MCHDQTIYLCNRKMPLNLYKNLIFNQLSKKTALPYVTGLPLDFPHWLQRAYLSNAIFLVKLLAGVFSR
jgi:hypothetical protein